MYVTSNDGLRKLCGCPRRGWPKCQHGWHFNFRWQGETYRFSLDKHLGRHIATRTEAKTAAEKIRAAIRDGTFRDGGPVLATLTVAEMLAQYHLRDLKKRRPQTADADLNPIALINRVVIPLPTTGARPFGAWVVVDVTTDTIERFREVRLEAGGGPIAVNRYLALLRGAWNWAIRVGYVDRTPFKRGTEAVVKLTKELPRSRRLETGEQEALLALCRSHLRSVVGRGTGDGDASWRAYEPPDEADPHESPCGDFRASVESQAEEGSPHSDLLTAEGDPRDAPTRAGRERAAAGCFRVWERGRGEGTVGPKPVADRCAESARLHTEMEREFADG